ncbi:MAG TPA: class I SAM-dependent methyltransferase [Stellaceae bacterium]|nr:class I SAM-dependent methyltransferase [Stellaceae bacterium]
MRASSLQNLMRCYRRHVAGRPLETKPAALVVAVGAGSDDGFDQAFQAGNFRFVLAEPEAPAFGPADIAICGMLPAAADEIARTFADLSGLLDPAGILFLLAPRNGADPDRAGVAAAASKAGLDLVESWTDERGASRDFVAVLRAAGAPAPVAASTAADHPFTVESTPEMERVGGSLPYRDILARLHRELAPAHYLEIGIRLGASLVLAGGPATGVDPFPKLRHELPAGTRVVAKASDDFFLEDGEARRADLAFIDGMHLVENALSDFMNVERWSLPGAVAVIDDILPNHPAQAARSRHTYAWTGDVWRLMKILEAYRPDLFLLPLDTAPTGLLLVAGLDPGSRVLWDRYDEIVTAALAWPGPPEEILARGGVVPPVGDGFDRVMAALRDARAGGAAPAEIAARARAALAGEVKPAPAPESAGGLRRFFSKIGALLGAGRNFG